MKENKIFKGCKATAKGFCRAKDKINSLDDYLLFYKNLIQERIRYNLIAECTQREKYFLELKTIEGKKLLDYVVEQFDVLKSETPGEYNFVIHALAVTLTDTEINDHGFYYNEGRDEIRGIARSIFDDKLGVPFDMSFEYKDRNIFGLWSMNSTNYASFC